MRDVLLSILIFPIMLLFFLAGTIAVVGGFLYCAGKAILLGIVILTHPTHANPPFVAIPLDPQVYWYFWFYAICAAVIFVVFPIARSLVGSIFQMLPGGSSSVAGTARAARWKAADLAQAKNIRGAAEAYQALHHPVNKPPTP